MPTGLRSSSPEVHPRPVALLPRPPLGGNFSPAFLKANSCFPQPPKAYSGPAKAHPLEPLTQCLPHRMGQRADRGMATPCTPSQPPTRALLLCPILSFLVNNMGTRNQAQRPGARVTRNDTHNMLTLHQAHRKGPRMQALRATTAEG